MGHHLNYCISIFSRSTVIASIAFLFFCASPECCAQKNSSETIEEIRNKGGVVNVDDEGRVTELSVCRSEFTNQDMQLLSKLTSIIDLNLNCQPILDDGINHIRNLSKLRNLGVVKAELTDKAMPTLATLAELQRLHLADNSNITDEGIKHLSTLANLKGLSVVGTAITDKGMKSIGKLENLEALFLENTKITDEGLKHISNLKKISTITLIDTEITDEGMRVLAELPELRLLFLDGTKITSDGMKHLVNLKELNSVYLDRTKVDKTALDVLSKCESLTHISVKETNVSQQAAKAFKEANPTIRLTPFEQKHKLWPHDQDDGFYEMFVPNEFPLGYDDPTLVQYCEISKEQLAKLHAISQQWDDEYQRLRQQSSNENNDASQRSDRRTIASAFSKFQKRCDDLLKEDQLELRWRFNILTTWGLEELQLMDRMILMSDPILQGNQRDEFYALKKEWIELADAAIPPSEEIDKATFFKNGVPGMAKLKQEHQDDFRKRLFNILDDKQAKRFSQIEWQRFATLNAVDTFKQKAVQEELNLSQEQIAKLDKILKKIEDAPDRFSSVRLKLDNYKIFFDSLTDPQKSKWRKFLGEPFKVTTNLNWLITVMNEDKASLKNGTSPER